MSKPRSIRPPAKTASVRPPKATVRPSKPPSAPPKSAKGHASSKKLQVGPFGVPSVVDDLDDDGTSTDQTGMIAPISLRTLERARFTIMTGASAGQVVPLDDDKTTIGRGMDANIRLADAGVSRIHSRIARTKKGRYYIEDMNSTNGTLVNGEKVTHHDLQVGDRVQIGPNVVLQFEMFDGAEDALAKRLYEQSTRDALTGVFNRRVFNERFSAEISFAERHRSPLAVLLMDLDNFKLVNDTHGHVAGDTTLRLFATTVQSMIRVEDVFARFGGEEFVLLVRGADKVSVLDFAERVRGKTQALQVKEGTATFSITVSIGVAMLSECQTKPAEQALLTMADERVYKAKSSGRNRVVG